ncbi:MULTISPECIES: hypothetical protein [unclassified Rhizobium]|uniref:hypothetical protein n=1 Tax=unclassified Rhizobium TaxID=2613769 RepID=UPI000EA94F35|nr:MULTISPECIES: hypothetical protein [unclassified Rhizobium]AYG70860.1 hypothetical protein CCGE531_33190 [Rhizobium sp. CCGE531]AYG77175.1 hypothetical protein CCGE532_32350 [Rhizobium sp. CCGE532]
MTEYVGKDDPLTILVGNNLGRTTWVSQVPVARLVHSAVIPNEFATPPLPDKGPADSVRQVLYGLVSGARVRRVEEGVSVISEFDSILSFLKPAPKRALRPVLAHIREIIPDNMAIRAERIFWHTRETLGFRVHIPVDYPWRLISGHAEYEACSLALDICNQIVSTKSYPAAEYFPTVQELSAGDLRVWLEALCASHSFTKLAAEFYVGISPEEEREIFLGLAEG